MVEKHIECRRRWHLARGAEWVAWTAILALALLAFGCASSGDESSRGPSGPFGGTWHGSLEEATTGNFGEIELTVEQSGTDISGTWSAWFGSGTLNSGTLSGDLQDDNRTVQLTLSSALTGPCPMSVTAVLQGEEAKGTYASLNCPIFLAGTADVYRDGPSGPMYAPPRPGTPTNVTATAGDTQITLNWSKASLASQHVVYASTKPNVTPQTGTRFSAPGLTFTHAGLKNGSTYYYLVAGTNMGGEGLASEMVSARPRFGLISSPTHVAATGASGQVTLTWQPVSTADGYNIYFGTSPGITKNNATKIPGATSPFVLAGLRNGVPYYFALTATNSAGESALSAEAVALPDAFDVAAAMAAARGHTLALKTDGTLWTSGNNTYGQLGLGDWANRTTPTLVGSTADWVAVAAGEAHSLGLKMGGSLWGWGENWNSQLGLGDQYNRASPTRIGVDSNWTATAAGFRHSIGLKTDGTLWAWGENVHGELGLGDTVDRRTPTRVGTTGGWGAVCAAAFSSFALKGDGSLWAWGANSYGELGLGDWAWRYTPTRVGSASDWAAVASGYGYALALKTDGSLWAWGDNYYGQLGLGDRASRPWPTPLGSPAGWAKVAVGSYHSLALKTYGSLWAWGDNSFYQLGLGDTGGRTTPTQVGAANDWAAIAAGGWNSLALKSDGSLWCWGANTDGACGFGDTTERSTPTLVGTGGWP